MAVFFFKTPDICRQLEHFEDEESENYCYKKSEQIRKKREKEGKENTAKWAKIFSSL